MGMTRVSKYAAATVTTFLVATCAVLYLSVNAKPVPGRGDLPSVSSGSRTRETQIEEIYVPMSEFPDETEELLMPGPVISEPDPYAGYKTTAQQILAEMTDDEKLYQLFIVTPEALMPNYKTIVAAGDATKNAIEKQPVGGIIYSQKNMQNAQQTTEMLTATQGFSKIPLFLGVDEEGGRVSRISALPSMGFDKLPSMADIGATGDITQAYETGAETGRRLSSLGFNLNFAPVADVLVNPDNEIIGDRSFGADPQLVANMTEGYTKGLRDSGIAATLKHFPGHGGTTGDTHNERTISERTLEQLRESEFLPFSSGIAAGADLVMMAHISAENINADGKPASLSPEIIELLRFELGFGLVVITDALDMGAITDTYESGDAAVQAVLAGADMLLMPENLEAAIQGLRDALDSGALTWQRIDESLMRILAVKLERGIIG